MDTSERDNAIRERDLEKKARKKLAYEKAELQLAYDLLKEQFKRLQKENEQLLRFIIFRNLDDLLSSDSPRRFMFLFTD